MCNRVNTVSSLLFARGQITRCLKSETDFMQFLFLELIPLRLAATGLIHVCLYKAFRSEIGMSSSEMSPTRASLTAESAAELLLMPTWPGTQIKTITFPSLVRSIYSSRICTKIGWSYFKLNTALSDESESDSIKNDISLEQ